LTAAVGCRNVSGMALRPPVLPDTPVSAAGFKLPLGAWIALGLYAALRVAVFSLRNGFASPDAISEFLGEMVAMLLIPGVIALLVWRLSKRSDSAGRAAFFVVLGLEVVAQAASFTRRVQAKAELSAIKDEQRQVAAEQRAALAQGRAVDSGKIERLAAKAGAQLDVIADASSGSEHIMAVAGKTYLDELVAAKKRYEDASNALHPKEFWSLQRLAGGVSLEGQRRLVRSFVKANADLGTFNDMNGTALRRILQTNGASPTETQTAVDQFIRGAGPRLPLLVKIRETDAELAQVMLDFIDFAEASRGKWRINASNGNIVFQDGGSVARYNALIKRATTISTVELDYQKRLVGAK
jgi:hypothetical protein